MNKIIGIDPGTENGAYVIWNPETRTIEGQGILPNDQLLEFFRTQEVTKDVVCEVIRGYGMNVGNETFDTCMWTGRLQEICHSRGQQFTGVGRKEIVKVHCGTTSAKDKDIRAVMLQKVGPQGNRKAPGPTYNISSHLWAALAVATGIADIRRDKEYFDMVQARNKQQESVL